MPSDRLLKDAKAMDGPVIPWTVADLFASNNDLFMNYHVMAAGWDVLSPVGSLLGAALYTVRVRPYPTLVASVGTMGFAFGTVGMALGLYKKATIAAKGEEASPPWTEDGKQMRVDGLRHNFKVRILDLGAWSGIALASAVLFSLGRTKVGLSTGFRGIAQGVALGSSVGSLCAVQAGYIMSTTVMDHNADA